MGIRCRAWIHFKYQLTLLEKPKTGQTLFPKKSQSVKKTSKLGQMFEVEIVENYKNYSQR